MAKGQVPPHAWKPGQSGNPAGRVPRRSMRWHANEYYTDEDREASIKALAKEARKGKAWAIEALCKLLGEGQAEPAAATINVLQLLTGADPQLAQRAFAALAMGVRDAGGLGVVRQSGELDAVAAPDDGERRPPADRRGRTQAPQG